MSACTFFGHHDCPSSIKEKLRDTLIDLIEHHAVDMFYVGQQGAFDAIVQRMVVEADPRRKVFRRTPWKNPVMPSYIPYPYHLSSTNHQLKIKTMRPVVLIIRDAY